MFINQGRLHLTPCQGRGPGVSRRTRYQRHARPRKDAMEMIDQKSGLLQKEGQTCQGPPSISS